MDQVDARLIPLPILFVILLMIAAVLVVLGFGLFVLAKEYRKPFQRHAVGGHRSTMLCALPVVVVVAVPVFAALLYLQHGDDRSNRGASVPTASDNEPFGDDVRIGTPASRSKLICGVSPVSDDLPAWICKPETRGSERKLVVVVGEQFVTEGEAEQNALEQAEQQLRADFDRRHPADIAWNIPLELVQAPVLLRNRFLRRIERTSGETTFHVQQMILQLELSPEGRELIYPVWRDRVVGHRLWILGRVLLLLTGILVAATIYFRLDTRTDGQFRLRLKLAAVSVIVAVGILIEKASPVLEQMVTGAP